MDYSKFNDYELVNMAQDNNEDAINMLHIKYKPLINKKCKKIYPYVSSKGLEYDDLVQECLIGFEEAIINFKQDDDVTFYTFCNICMDRQLKSEITKLNRDKHKILNEAIPISVMDDSGEELNLVDFFVNDSNDPLKDILSHEKFMNLIRRLKGELTDFEECVFELRLQDFDYREIAKILDKEPKSIDNALTRIKIKFRKIIDENNK